MKWGRKSQWDQVVKYRYRGKDTFGKCYIWKDTFAKTYTQRINQICRQKFK